MTYCLLQQLQAVLVITCHRRHNFLLPLATGSPGWRRRQAPVGLRILAIGGIVYLLYSPAIFFRKSLHTSPPPCLGVLGPGQITSNLPIKFYQDTSSLFLGDRALGFWGAVLQDLFGVWCARSMQVHLPGVMR
jgi:hypothetical protein